MLEDVENIGFLAKSFLSVLISSNLGGNSWDLLANAVRDGNLRVLVKLQDVYFLV